LRCSLPPDVDVEKLGTFHEEIKENFPERKERIKFSAGFKMKGPGLPEALPATSGVDGFQFLNKAEAKAVQVRLDGFSFHKLKPYVNWESMRDEAEILWRKYVILAKPRNVNRIGLRYINQLELPMPVKDFKDYILTVLEIAPKLPQGISEMFMKIVTHDPDSGAQAIITEALQPVDIKKNIVPIIFDIDSFYMRIEAPTERTIWDLLEKLRDFKNRIFFFSTTEKAKELFK